MSRVDEQLMAPGSFTIDLDPATPGHITDLTDQAFMRIVITSIHVDPDAITYTDLLGCARYSGIYRRRSRDRCRWEGAGLAILLGDEDGKANTYTTVAAVGARPLYDGPSNTSWIRNNVLRPSAGGSNGVTAGTIPTAGSPTKAGNTEPGDSPRDVLDFACDLFSTTPANPWEWRINPPGTLDANLRNLLFPTTAAPVTLATRDTDALAAASGDDHILPVTDLDQVDDWEDWTSTVSVIGPTIPLFGTEYTYSGSATIGSNPYQDLDGDELVMRRVVTSNKSKSDADNDTIAARKLNRFSVPHRRPSIRTDIYDVGDVARPGDVIWLFDADTGCYDTVNQVDGGAGLVFPLPVRVPGIDWPIRDGMGVYAVVFVTVGETTTPVVTDLTDYLIPDESDARVDLGEPRRRLIPRRPRWLAETV